jgi:hypothetical protein
MSTRKFTAGAAMASLSLAACAAPPPKPVVRDQLVTETATVTSINHDSRLVTLRGEDGGEWTVIVDPAVKNLPQVQEGDKVVAKYYESIAAEVTKPGQGVKGVEATVGGGVAQPGERPAGAVGTQLRTTVTIESVDTTMNTVSFKRDDGMSRTVAIQTPEGQKFIRGLKPGDQVDVTYTEAVAMEVRPAD